MHTVYILYSIMYDKIYIGFTSHLDNRIISHNQLDTKGYTIKYRPWIVAYTEVFENKAQALKREKYLKSTQGRKLVWNIVRQKYGSSDG